MLDAAKMAFLKALKDLLPFAKPLRSGIHPPLWFVDFFYEGKLDGQVISQLEEAMRVVVKKNSLIKSQEMLLSNAIEYWTHYDELEKVESYQGVEDGVFHFLMLDKILEEGEEFPVSTLEAGEVQILSLKETAPMIYRVWGSSCETKDEMKNLKKRFIEEGKRKKGEPIYTEKGLLWKKKESEQIQKIIKKLFEECAKEKISYLFTPPEGKFESHLQLFQGSGASIWRSFELEQVEEVQNIAYMDDPFTTDLPLKDVQFRFFPEERLKEELISSLQFIDRITTIFGINGEWQVHYDPAIVKSKKRFKKLFEVVLQALENRKAIETKTNGSELSIEFMLVDSIGRRWPGSRIELIDKPVVIKNKEGEAQVEGLKVSLFLSFERWMSFIEDKSTN